MLIRAGDKILQIPGKSKRYTAEYTKFINLQFEEMETARLQVRRRRLRLQKASGDDESKSNNDDSLQAIPLARLRWIKLIAAAKVSHSPDSPMELVMAGRIFIIEDSFSTITRNCVK